MMTENWWAEAEETAASVALREEVQEIFIWIYIKSGCFNPD